MNICEVFISAILHGQTFFATCSQLHTSRILIERVERGKGLRKKVKIELEDTDGTKYSFALEGKISKDKILKVMDALELMEIPLDNAFSTLQRGQDGTFYSRVREIIESDFAGLEFSSSDIARQLEEKHGTPVKLSTVSTYLARLADEDYLKRERFGNSWVYRRNYLKARS